MSIKQFLIGLFQGSRLASEDLETARQAGKSDAAIFGAYLDGFEEESARILSDRQNRILGHSGTKTVNLLDRGDERQEDHTTALESLSRPELMRMAKERGVSYSRSSTRDDLVEALA